MCSYFLGVRIEGNEDSKTEETSEYFEGDRDFNETSNVDKRQKLSLNCKRQIINLLVWILGNVVNQKKRFLAETRFF